MSLVTQETIWAARVLEEAGVDMDKEATIRSDNKADIKWATVERYPSGHAKHIGVRVHFIRKLV